MSTSVTLKDSAELLHAIARLRTADGNSAAEAYVLIHHDEGNPNVISLEHEGEGIEDLASQLHEAEVQYAILRVREQLDITVAVKFVYIHWIGDKVPFTKKGRFGVVHGSVKENLPTCHADLETSSVDDITAENINRLINETSGTKSKVIDGNNTEGRHMRGFTSVPLSKGPGKSKANLVPVSAGGAAVKHGEDVTEAILDVRSDDSATTWACIGYEDDDVKKPLKCVSKGDGNVDELKHCLADDKPFYFLYRTTDTIDGHVTVKFVYIIWVGEQVKPLAKAKLSTHKGYVQELFSGCHVSIFATSRSEISRTIVTDKVQSASGSKSNVK